MLGVHAIRGSASVPTAGHQRRRPQTADDRAGNQNRQFVGTVAEGEFAAVIDGVVAGLAEQWFSGGVYRRMSSSSLINQTRA
jgi:hypothetical protein